MVAVIDVLFASITLVAGDPPMLTVAPVRKPVPVIVIPVPPLVVPVLGMIEVTVGAGFDDGVDGLGVDARPPPQPGNDITTSRELTGNQFLQDIRGTLLGTTLEGP